MNLPYPPISVVIIGLNVEAYLQDCISSVLNADYPADLLDIIYVDGGSMDRSVAIAESNKGVTVISLKSAHPTPGRGRNAGYKASAHPTIQFLDGDTVIASDWLKTAVPCLKDDIGAIRGKVIEKYPRKNFYHLIGDIEWHVATRKSEWERKDGPSDVFGGNVLIRKEVLDAVGGYDEKLVAGEDPDISYRIRHAGWVIYQINTDMVFHDLNMKTFHQYAKRGFRSGHAYAEIGLRYIHRQEKYFSYQLSKVFFGALLPVCIAGLGFVLNAVWTGLVLAGLFAFKPLIKMMIYGRGLGLDAPKACLYGIHLSVVRYIQFFGVLRYLWTCLFGVPLRNKGYGIK